MNEGNTGHHLIVKIGLDYISLYLQDTALNYIPFAERR